MFDLPRETQRLVSVFTTSNQWQVWNKPRNATMLNILAIGGGGGGGGGLSGLTLTNRIAGGGGGCGVVGRLLLPTIFLPDQLYILVGAGGGGGATDTAGTAGSDTYISVADNTAAEYTILRSRAGVGGGSGGAANGGSGGTGFAATRYTTYGLFLTVAGQSGGNGNVGNASAVTPSVSSMCIEGTGGGGVNNADTQGTGATMSASGLIPAIAGGAVGGGNGSPGFFIPKPMTMTGGTGGGGNATGVGGRGGNGAGYGTGGGGGGSGLTGFGGGAGGSGSPGYAILTAW